MFALGVADLLTREERSGPYSVPKALIVAHIRALWPQVLAPLFNAIIIPVR